MASVVEDSSFSFNLQADSLSSGSISFGRYEKESLCWEKWSSFSHNRYLEDVEKYSRPGSVTEKKAYFEAHFKKRALMRQNSCRIHSTTKHETDEYDFGSFRERSYSARFDESPVSSISEQDFEHTITSYSDHHNENGLVNIIDSEVRDLPLLYNEQAIGVIENHSAEIRASNIVLNVVDLSASAHEVEAEKGIGSELQEDPSNQGNILSQPKQKKAEIKSRFTGAQGKRNISNGPSKDITSKPIKKETSVPLQSKRENKVYGTSSATTRSSHRMQKHEIPCYSKTKAHFSNKSTDIESRSRTINSLRSASEVAPKANPCANRPKKSVNSTIKPQTEGSAFSIRSDNRAQSRKELVEKIRAKEGESPQLRIKTQGTLSDKKTNKPLSKSSISGTETSEPLNKSDTLSSFHQTRNAPSASRGATHASQARLTNLTTKKKEQPKDQTNLSMQRYKVSDANKVIKGQKIEGKSKPSHERSTTSVIRKDVKAVHLGSSSRMGCVAS